MNDPCVGDKTSLPLTIEAVGDDEMVLKDVLVQESTGKVGCHFNILRGAECLQVSAGGTGSQRSTQVSGPGISRLQAFHHGC